MLRRLKALFEGTPPATRAPAAPAAATPAADPPPAPQRAEMPAASPLSDPAVDAAEQARQAGNAALKSGQLDAALGHYDRFVRLDPGRAAAHLNRGFVLMRMGRLDAACDALAEAWRLDPAEPEAAFFLARALLQSGRPAEALEPLKRAVVLRPSFVPAWVAQGEAHEALGDPAAALEAHQVAVRLDAQHLPALQGIARCSLVQKDFALALQATQQWLEREPQAAQGWGMQADALRRLGRLDEALAAAERGYALAPADLRVAQAKGEALLALERYAEARALLEPVADGRPDDADVLAVLGSARCGVHDYEGGLSALREARRLEPTGADALHNEAFALMSLQRFDEAADALRTALAQGVGDARTQIDLAVALLTTGRWREGWQRYEWRLQPGAVLDRSGRSLVKPPPPWPWPRWMPGDTVAGRRVLLHPEQGLGDSLQFLRYVPDVVALGAQVLLSVPGRIAPLLGDGWPGCRRIEGELRPDEVDLHCPLLSLPYVLGLGEPSELSGPYVQARPERRAHWRTRLAGDERPRIGLVWAGNPDHPDDARRSMPLEPLRQALQPLTQLRFVSLQMVLRDRDREAMQRWPELMWIGDEQGDMADTAALIEALDAIVCVDTSVAHLTGALDRPLYLLLMHTPDWRWGLHGRRTPWYRSATLLRQPAPGDWPAVVAALRDELLGAHAHRR